MGWPPRPRTVLYAALRVVLLSAGFVWLVKSSVEMLGGVERLNAFTRTEMHRYTAMAMLTGTLRLRSSLAQLGFDEQVHDGAGYTNWGFGVPLLQLPFHAVALKWMHSKFFPDRAIYMAYHAAAIPLVWAGFSRLVAMRDAAMSRIKRDALAWAATFLVLASALFPLMSCRFTVYEETICYLVLCELVALACYLFAARSWGAGATCGVGAAAGLGLLVRPTGLIYLGVWAALVLLEGRARRAMVAFAAGAAPFVVFWMYSNRVKTGSVVGLGFGNAVVNNVPQMAMVRFGSTCLDDLHHVRGVAASLFRALFVAVPTSPPRWMDKCHFAYEQRPPSGGEAFLGLTVFALLAWILLHLVARRERRLAAYVPLAALVAMFGSYVYAGAGMAWRYAGDFWPLIALACVEYVRSLPRRGGGLLGVPLTVVLTLAGVGAYTRSTQLWPPQAYYGERWESVPPSDEMWTTFLKSRWDVDKPLASRVRCGDPIPVLITHTQGWNAGCGVDVITNVYLGLPKSADDRYDLRLETTNMESSPIKIYVNGRQYTATRVSTGFEASVEIPQSRLHSPIVVATVEWARTDPPRGKFVSIEIAPRG